MQQGFYRFEHKYYSRNGNQHHGRSSNWHLSAKGNYNTNTNKVLDPEDSIRINFSSDRHEFFKELLAHSATVTRANGRLGEDFTISFDKNMSVAHQREALRNFAELISFGRRIRVAADIHRNDPENPHAHVLVIDRDHNGQQVAYFGRSASFRRDNSPIKGNPTTWLRQAWEFECNAVLAIHGYDFRVDCRTNLERGLAEAHKPRGYEADLKAAEMEAEHGEAEQVPQELPVEQSPPNTPTHELPEPAEEPIPAEDETDAEDAQEGAEDMPINSKLNLARRQANELRIMRGKRAEAARLRSEYAYWGGEAVSARQKAEVAHNAFIDAQARSITAAQAMKETHFMGFRKGINWKLGPFQIRTAGFEKAVQAEAEHAKATYAEALRSADLREAEAYANRATQKVYELEQRVASLEQHITMHERINGEEQDFELAEIFFRDSIQESLKGVSPNDVIDAYEQDQLTLEEAKDLLQEMGHPELVNWIEAQQEEQGVKH